MKNQTLSIEQMKHLKDLGVDVSKASMCWWLPMERLRSEEGYLLDAYEPYVKEQMSDDPIILAFTLQDMLEMMPKCIINHGIDYNLSIYGDFVSYSHFENGNHKHDIVFVKCKYGLLEGIYQVLCWLAEKGHLEGSKP